MSSDKRLNGARILLVDDELVIAAALRDYFILAGAEHVETATTLSAAFTFAEEQSFDAALLDLTLPDGETTELARHLSDAGVHIVFHSGSLLPNSTIDRVKAATVMQKPASPDELVDALAWAI